MGVEAITTVLVAAQATSPAGAYDLTDLATVHDELSLPTVDTQNDAFLSRAITQVSTAIATYCKRVFAVEAIQDQFFIQQDPYPWQNPAGVFALQLSRWPLVATGVASFTGNTNGTSDVTGISSMAGIEEGQLIFAADGTVPAGTTILSLGAGALVMSNAATSNETALSLSTGVQVVQELSVGNTQTLVYGQDFTIDANKGWLVRLDKFTGVATKWESIPTTVQYQAGYGSASSGEGSSTGPGIPFDLVDACLRLVTARFRARGRDPLIVSQDRQGAGGVVDAVLGGKPARPGRRVRT